MGMFVRKSECCAITEDYKVRDISLAAAGRKAIEPNG
jgi:hypothetical protein